MAERQQSEGVGLRYKEYLINQFGTTIAGKRRKSLQNKLRKKLSHYQMIRDIIDQLVEISYKSQCIQKIDKRKYPEKTITSLSLFYRHKNCKHINIFEVIIL